MSNPAVKNASSVWPLPPARLLFVVLALHLLLWTLIPALLNQNLPLDVIEGLVWGNEWQWGYDKHPPVSAWMMEGMAWLTGYSDWGQYLLSQLCVVIAFYAIWSIASEMVDQDHALLSVLLLEGVYFHNYTTPEFNANVALLFFWSLTLWFFWRSYKHDRLIDWILCGVFAALALLSKYFAAVLLLPLLLFLLLDKAGRHYFKRRHFYAGLSAALLLLAPHLIWMVANDFITIHYAMNRSGGSVESSLIDHIKNPLKFFAAYVAVVVPVLGMTYALGLSWRRATAVISRENLFVWLVFVLPLISVMLLSTVTGMRLRSMWAYPLFLPVGLLVASLFSVAATEWKLKRFMKTFVGINLFFISAYVAVQVLTPLYREAGKRTHFPGRELAAEVQRLWMNQTDKPLRYIGGDPWLAGNAAWYSGAASRPSVSIELNKARSPWVDDEAMRRDGALILWSMGSAASPSTFNPPVVDSYRERFGSLVVGAPIKIRSAAGGKSASLLIGWGIVPPAARLTENE